MADVVFWNFPSYDKWKRGNDTRGEYYWKDTIGDYTCIVMTTLVDDMYRCSLNIYASNDPNLIPDVYRITLQDVISPIEKSVKQWYETSINIANNRWKSFIQDTYIRKIYVDGDNW